MPETTVVSAPPTSVTVDQLPENPVQVPPERGEESRWTIALEASTPAPLSVPLASVSGTDSEV